MKYSEQLFGNSELALRLPNLLLLFVYMVYSYLMFKNSNSFLTIAMFSLLCTNCLLMDLFGLARGYGLSCGFMLMSLYHFIEYFKDKRIKNLVLFHTAALLACLSQFTLLTFYVSIMIAYSLIMFIYYKFIIDEKYNFYTSNKVHIIPLLIVTIVLYEPVRRLLAYGTLDFGGKTGFYANTITHLILNTFQGISLPLYAQLIFQITFTCLILASLFIIVRNIIRKNKSFFEQYIGLIISCFLLILISTIIILLHLLLGADYPIARFSIFLFPVFMVHIGFLSHYFLASKFKKVILVSMFGIALVSMISFWQRTNLYSSGEWAYDMETKNMIQTLAAYREKKHGNTGNIKLGINWLFEPTINFYRVTKEIDWLSQVNRNGVNNNYDYYYIFKDELNQLDSSGIEVIEKYKNINTLLIANTKSINNKKLMP